jgi:hypothetical protein
MPVHLLFGVFGRSTLTNLQGATFATGWCMRVFFHSLLILIVLGVSSCTIGPGAINAERVNLTDAIAVTSRQQLLLNLVRAYNNEQLQFVDISQVINTSQLSGTFMLTENFPQAVAMGAHSGHDYTPAFTVSGYDQPSITYVPLLGGALVAQIAQPITVDSIAALYDSGWKLGPLLALTAKFLGPSPNAQQTIIEDLGELADNNALLIVPQKSLATNGPGGDDSLELYCDPDRAPGGQVAEAKREWDEISGIFQGTYINPRDIGIVAPSGVKGHGDPSSYSIELRTVPASQPSVLTQNQVIPLLRTRSALGAVMNAANPDIGWTFFVDGEDPPSDLRKEPTKGCWLSTTLSEQPYTLPGTSDLKTLVSQATTFPSLQGYSGVIVLASDKRVRRYILVHRGLSGPKKNVPYVIVSRDGEKYWIDGTDEVSQKNFELLSLLLTMQAQSSATPPPIPAITVGGH